MKFLIALFLLGSFVAIRAAERDYRCPLLNPEFVVHLPHETDCTLFYKCDWGHKVLFECPPGLHFNPTLEVCDWPEDAGCEAGNGGDSTPGDGSTETPTENPVEGPGTTGDGGGDGGGGTDPRCPPNNDGLAVHFPHEEDCTKFYKCDWGVPVLQHCPDGLHFNPRLEVCDWPADAGCEAGSGGDSTPGDGSTVTPTENPVEGPGTTGDGGGGDGGGTDPRCPPNNDGLAVHFPHEEDCTKFYKCDWGIPVLQHCPDGLHFNPRLEVCDWPADAGCGAGNGGDSTPGDGSTETPTENPVEGPGTTGDGGGDGGGGTDPRCPPNNDGLAVHFPHEEDCTKFYKCDWGVPVLQHCPDGLHFNPRLEVCDWPADAGCEAGNGGDSTPGDGSTETPTENPVEGPGTTGDGGGDGGGGTDPRCPPNNDGLAVHFPHEEDCTKFYKCDWGIPVLQHCPDGLHFNPRLEVCDWPADAGCEAGNGGDSTPGDGSTETPTENPVEGPGTTGDGGGDGGGGTDPRCPPNNDGLAVHFPHEEDCTKFYKCDWGIPVLQHCPDGLHFNPRLEVCDWPADAGCEAGNGGDSTPGDGSTVTPTENPVEGPGTTGDGGGGDGGGTDPRCPPNNDGLAVHFPHEEDCTKFYKCDWGIPVLQHCPDGLHFNPRLEVCDWPADAGCEAGNGGDSTPGDGSTVTPTENPVEGPGTTGDGGGGDGGGTDPRCPPNNDGLAVHFPHEEDCTKFYKCDWGIPVLQHCPDGLHFNPRLEVCDWPADAGCEAGNGGDSTPGDGSTETPTENPVEGPGTTGDGGGGDGGGTDPRCPPNNDGLAVHLPNEEDCTKFYKCDWGVPVPLDCPDGLHFNPRLEVCDWPEDAGCRV